MGKALILTYSIDLVSSCEARKVKGRARYIKAALVSGD